MEKTTKYSIFNLKEENREVNKTHLKRLISSIKEKNMLNLKPIIVNSNFDVIDGQHRLRAAEELGVEIYYIVDDSYGSNAMILLNTSQKEWRNEDYINYWVSKGNENYVMFSKLIHKHNFSYSVAMGLLTSYSPEEIKAFKEGKFIYPQGYDTTGVVHFYKEVLESLLNKRTRPVWMVNSFRFILSIKKLFKSDKIDTNIMITRINNFPGDFIIRSSSKDYFIQFLEIYNYKQKNRLNLSTNGKKYEII